MVAIAAGGSHTVALKGDGTVVAWGDNSLGQTTVPTGLSGVVAISAKYYQTVALKIDGSVVAWGANIYGQTTVPSGLSDIVAIAAGGYHTMALKGDGTVTVWGRNDSGQCNVPSGLTGVAAIAAGSIHSVALVGDGSTPDVLTFGPFGGRVYTGETFQFYSQVTGLRPIYHQWRKDGVVLPLQTNSTLALNNVELSDAGGYTISQRQPVVCCGRRARSDAPLRAFVKP